MNKKYSDFNTLYNGLRVTVDSDTKTALDEHFMYREVNSNDRFEFFYKRNLNLHCHQYELMALDELSEIPDLVDYKEFVINQKKTGKTLVDSISNITKKITSDTEQKLKEATDSDTFNSTDKLTGTEGVTSSYSEDDDLTHGKTTTNTGTQSNTNSANNQRSHIELMLDQGVQYPGATAGVMPSLDFTDASGQSMDANNESGTSQRIDNLSEAESGTDARDISGSGSETTTHNTTDTKNGSYSSTFNDETNITKNGSDDITATGSKNSQADEKVGEYNRKEIMTKFETELRNNIWQYILSHHAIEWLFGVLENCFMPPSFDED